MKRKKKDLQETESRTKSEDEMLDELLDELRREDNMVEEMKEQLRQRKRKFWRNRVIWYLFAARSEVWYPPLGESRGLVPAKAARALRDQAFLQAPGTKSPKLTEIGIPNLDFRQSSG